MTTHKVGGEVDAYCTRCRLTLAHTILAMVGTKIARVRCNTCGGDHAYRSEAAHRPSALRAPSVPRAERVVVAWEQRLAGKDLSKAKKYSAKETFAIDDVVDHPAFGLGLVTAVRGDKVDIAFKAFEKTLVHKRSDGAPNRPTYQAFQLRGQPAEPAQSASATDPELEPAESARPGEGDGV